MTEVDAAEDAADLTEVEDAAVGHPEAVEVTEAVVAVEGAEELLVVRR